MMWSIQRAQILIANTFSIISLSTAVSEMEGSIAALFPLACVCVFFYNVSGALMEIKVRPGENITLYCDQVIPVRSDGAWFRNCSDESHPPLLMSVSQSFPRLSFVRNSSSKTYDLFMRNITANDLGLYYCARLEKDNPNRTVYYYGRLATRLILRDAFVPCAIIPQSTPVSDCSVYWKMMVILGPVCVLISSVLSSTCVYCICRYKHEATRIDTRNDQQRNVKTRNDYEAGEEDVCYTSLDVPKGRHKPLKKKQVENSNFCTYSEVKTQRI